MTLKLVTNDSDRPDLETAFQACCGAFLQEQPWCNLRYPGEAIDFQQGQDTVSCAIRNEGGLVVEYYADPFRHNGEFLNLTPTLLLMFHSYDPAGPLPTVVRMEDSLRRHPRPEDLELMGTVLEWLTEFTRAGQETVTVQDGAGLPVTVGWGYLNEIDEEQVREDELRDRLDTLWWQAQHEDGVRQCAVAVLESPHLQWRQRLASHLYCLELFDELEELYRKFRGDTSEEWLYIGALCAFRRGKKRTFRRRVDKAAATDDYGFFLYQADEYSDSYLHRWRKLWMESPEAVQYLKGRIR